MLLFTHSTSIARPSGHVPVTFFPLLLLILGFSATIVSAQDSTAGGDDDQVAIQYIDTPLPFILLEYEKLTGKKIIRDATIETASLSIETNGTLSRAEAVRFIEKSLLLNGFVLVPSGDNTLKILSEGTSPSSEGVPVIFDAANLPETDQLVTFIMALNHLAGEDVMQAFTEIAPSHAYGQITVLPDGGTLAITDNTAIIRKYIELQHVVDVPAEELTTRTFTLERADALDVAEELSELLELDSDDSSSAPNARPAPSDGEAAVAASGGAQPRIRLQPKIRAIERTNRLLVIAHPLEMAAIEALVDEFDAPTTMGNTISRPLRYVKVQDFLYIARDALLRRTDGGNSDSGAPSVNRRGNTSSSTTSSLPAQNNNAFGGIGGQSGQNSGARASLTEPDDLGGPMSLVVGRTLLIADPAANELYVSGPPENLRVIEELIDRIDKKPRQVFLSTVIGQLTLGDELETSVDLFKSLSTDNVGGEPVTWGGAFRTSNRFDSNNPNDDSGEDGLLDPDNLARVASRLATGNGLTMYGQVGNELTGFLQLLESSARFQVLSRPSIFTLNNEKAIIQTGQKVAIPVNSLSSLNTGTLNPSVASSIQYQDVVLRLEVVPLINSDDEVTLRISQVNDDITGSTTIGGNEVPTISTQEMVTTVIVKNKTTVLLGGLISEDDSGSKSGFPGLVRIPVLGRLFGTHKDGKTRQELLIFIQPHIITNDEDLADANHDAVMRTELGEDALDFALPELPPRPEFGPHDPGAANNADAALIPGPPTGPHPDSNQR